MKKQIISPVQFGLNPETVIEVISKNHIAIVISRKSRIIMSDGKKILEKATKIKRSRADVKISLKTSTPICSKTVRFLSDHGIKIIIP